MYYALTRLFFAFLLSVVDLYAAQYNRTQLPLLPDIQKTFPLITANRFMIANTDTMCVLNEKGADGDSSSINLYTAAIFGADDKRYVCYKYKNVNKCNFIIVLYYNEYYVDQIQQDKEYINKWLDMFYISKVSCIKCHFASTRIIYADGVHNVPATLKKDIQIITTKRCAIKKVLRYKSSVKAPVHFYTKIGSLNIYSIFVNPISIPIYAHVNVKKTTVYKRILESIRILIFGQNS